MFLMEAPQVAVVHEQSFYIIYHMSSYLTRNLLKFHAAGAKKIDLEFHFTRIMTPPDFVLPEK